jgi:biotin carboxyl carrier protein
MTLSCVVDGEQFLFDLDGKGSGLALLEGSHRQEVDFKRFEGSLYTLIVDGVQTPCSLEKTEEGYRVTLRGKSYEVRVARGAESGPSLAKKQKHHEEIIKSPMPGLIVAVRTEPGQKLKKGEAIIVLEAMKMQNELRAGHDCTVKEIFVQPGQPVEKGEKLVSLEA